jgi:hypothetical protein
VTPATNQAACQLIVDQQSAAVAAAAAACVDMWLLCLRDADRCFPDTPPTPAQAQALTDCTALHAVRIPECWGL